MARGAEARRRLLGMARSALALAVGEGVAAGWATSEWLADRVVRVVRRGRRVVGDRGAVRGRRLRRLNRHPLANLWEVHPEARLAQARELGLRSVALDEIAGTAVAGAAQRGGDFLPLPGFRSPNWRARWQRIRAAVDRLELLPPIDLVKYAGRYWVTDGHNRVAAALYAGQVEIDAVATALVAPGAALDDTPATLAELAADSHALRVAGSGRWTSAASQGAIDETNAAMDRTEDAATFVDHHDAGGNEPAMPPPRLFLTGAADPPAPHDPAPGDPTPDEPAPDAAAPDT